MKVDKTNIYEIYLTRDEENKIIKQKKKKIYPMEHFREINV